MHFVDDEIEPRRRHVDHEWPSPGERRAGALRFGAGLRFAFTNEQQMFQRAVREFVDRDLTKEYCRHVEASEEFPWEMWSRLVGAGFTGRDP